MFSNQRYLTKGVQADIPFELQIFMWGCIDRLPEERDYFQIFKLDNLDGIQRIAYVNDGRVTIFKRPKPAHKVHFNTPAGTRAIMGHTRMTTKGNEKHNFNNHPFPGHADREFTFAHNGVLYKSKRISYYAKTKAEAVKKLHEEEYKIHFNKYVDPTSTKLVDWLRLWLENYMRNNLKQSTYVSYRGYIENHIAPAFPNLKLKDLTTRLLQDFYNYKLNNQGMSPKTISNLHRCLHKALNQAVLEHS